VAFKNSLRSQILLSLVKVVYKIRTSLASEQMESIYPVIMYSESDQWLLGTTRKSPYQARNSLSFVKITLYTKYCLTLSSDIVEENRFFSSVGSPPPTNGFSQFPHVSDGFKLNL